MVLLSQTAFFAACPAIITACCGSVAMEYTAPSPTPSMATSSATVESRRFSGVNESLLTVPAEARAGRDTGPEEVCSNTEADGTPVCAG